MALPHVFQSPEMAETDPVSLAGDRAEEVAAIKREIAQQLGHQCGECLTDALVARFLDGLSKYDLKVEVEAHVAAADRLAYDIDALITGAPSEVASPELLSQREIRNELELLSRALGWENMTAKLVEIDHDLPAAAVGLESPKVIDLRETPEGEVDIETPVLESALLKQAPTARLMSQVQSQDLDPKAEVQTPSLEVEAPVLESDGIGVDEEGLDAGDRDLEDGIEQSAEHRLEVEAAQRQSVDHESVSLADEPPAFEVEEIDQTLEGESVEVTPVALDQPQIEPEAEPLVVDDQALDQAEVEDQDFAQWEKELEDSLEVSEPVIEEPVLDEVEREDLSVDEPALDQEQLREFADFDLDPDIEGVWVTDELEEPNLEVEDNVDLEVEDNVDLEVEDSGLEPEGLEPAALEADDFAEWEKELEDKALVVDETEIESPADDFAQWENELADPSSLDVAEVEAHELEHKDHDLELPAELTAAYALRLESAAVRSLSSVAIVKEHTGVLERMEQDQAEHLRRMRLLAKQVQSDRLVPIRRNIEFQEEWEKQVPPLPTFDSEGGLVSASSFRKVRGNDKKEVWFNPDAENEKKRRRLIGVATISGGKAKTERLDPAKEVIESGCKGCNGGAGCCGPAQAKEVAYARFSGKDSQLVDAGLSQGRGITD